MGSLDAPRIFTKMLKPVFAHLRSLGHICMSHIDDSLLIGYDYKSCENNIADSVSLFSQLGFVAHPEKSVLQPAQSIEFLGFVSTKMTVKLLPYKVAKIKSMCNELLSKQQPTIQEVAQLIGVLVSSFPGVQFGPLHYRNLEQDKISALQNNKGNFESPMTLSSWAETELNWWINSIDSAFKPILPDNSIVTITTDASSSG